MEAKLGTCRICTRLVVLTRLERCEECFRLEYIVQKDLAGVLKILEQLDMTVLEWIPTSEALPTMFESVITRGNQWCANYVNAEIEWHVYPHNITHWARVVLP